MKYLLKYSLVTAFIVLTVTTHVAAGDEHFYPSPPGQPLAGPNGRNYEHADVMTKGPYWTDRVEGFGVDEANKYFILLPDNPAPDYAPVVLFLHGWQGINPANYEQLLNHIVKKGYIVVWVEFQRDQLTPPWTFHRRAILLWQDALKRLDSGEFQVKPEKDENGGIKTAFVGHSIGGYLAAVIAAKAANEWKDIPNPYVIVAFTPGGKGLIPGGNLALKKIPPATKVVIVVGEEDLVVCKSTALHIWSNIPQIPDKNKDFLLVKSDYHGQPEQVANHYFPLTSGARDTAGADARDFYVTFKLSVAALNCAFRGINCEYALGKGREEQVFMGTWSDGQPIEPMIWVKDPESLETTCKDHGPKYWFFY